MEQPLGTVSAAWTSASEVPVKVAAQCKHVKGCVNIQVVNLHVVQKFPTVLGYVPSGELAGF